MLGEKYRRRQADKAATRDQDRIFAARTFGVHDVPLPLMFFERMLLHLRRPWRPGTMTQSYHRDFPKS
jgi:hypothetical protein